MTIGELAGAAGVGVETVRYYQRIGLLEEPPRPPRGFRRYSPESLHRLHFIRKAKELGFSLVDTRELLSLRQREESCAQVCALANRHLEQIRRRIDELRKLEGQLTEMVGSCPEESECAVLRTLSAPVAGALTED